jgi:hypothetical protein
MPAHLEVILGSPADKIVVARHDRRGARARSAKQRRAVAPSAPPVVGGSGGGWQRAPNEVERVSHDRGLVLDLHDESAPVSLRQRADARRGWVPTRKYAMTSASERTCVFVSICSTSSASASCTRQRVMLASEAQ